MKLTNGDRVDFHRVEAGGERGVDAGKRLGKLPTARDGGELFRIERVERDVHARKARVAQVVGHLRQQHAVGGQRYVLNAGRGADVAHQIDHALAHERLAPGQAHAAYPHSSQHAHDMRNLLDAQDVLMAKRFHALFGHAVYAAVIAAIGQRNAQVIDRAAVSVLHDFPSRRTSSVPLPGGMQPHR